MIRFWGQPKYAAQNGKFIGYELFLREREGRDGQWQLPDDFGQFDAATITALLAKTCETLPKGLQLVSFNLDQAEFIDPAYIQLLAQLQAQLPFELIIELTEHGDRSATPVTREALLQATEALAETGLHVCLDDVGTGENQLELVKALLPFTSEYKFALQNVRGSLSMDSIREQIEFWSTLARQHHKTFALEGLETSQDNVLIHDFRPDIVQGYYYGKPHALPIAADF